VFEKKEMAALLVSLQVFSGGNLPNSASQVCVEGKEKVCAAVHTKVPPVKKEARKEKKSGKKKKRRGNARHEDRKSPAAPVQKVKE
jgi:hypothetical protein